jgi:hypothetical protein
LVSVSDYSLGNWYSTHLTTSPSKLTSIAAFTKSLLPKSRIAASEESTLEGWNDIGSNNEEARVQLYAAEDLKEIYAVVGDEGKLVFNDPLSHYPVRLAAQTEVIDVACVEAMCMCYSNQ